MSPLKITSSSNYPSLHKYQRIQSNWHLAMAEKLKAIGKLTPGGCEWDDGSDHDDVSKIYVRGGLDGIQTIHFEYIKSGQPQNGTLFGVWGKGFTQTVEIDHLNGEHLESVEGYYDKESSTIQSLQFKTNFKVSEVIGYDKGDKFSLSAKGKKIIGFHGHIKKKSCPLVTSLGAYFTWIPPSRLEAKGGQGGTEWDDGADHEGITKIHVRGGSEGIRYIKFDYVKNGYPKVGSVRGVSGGGFSQKFEIEHFNNEHLVSLEGYYDEESNIIQGLQFKTNLKTSAFLGYEKGTKFSIAQRGNKITGFHGYADKNLISIGAYFKTISVTKSDCGDIAGSYWDDGVFDGIRKVYVGYYIDHVTCIMFDYNNGHSVVKREHGTRRHSATKGEFEVDYPNELLISVDGTFTSQRYMKLVTSLVFKTSKGRISPTFGDVNGTKFVLENKGCALVRFHGWTSLGVLSALGGYFSPMPLYPSTEKLEAQSYDGGAITWNDGAFDNVKKIYVGICENGISFLKFVYDKNTRMVIGDDHGNKTPLEIKELELEYPSEYIEAVAGRYNKSNGSETEVITMLKFKTNKRTSIPFGFKSSSRFLLYKEDFKIVGFHGKASNMIHQLDVHFMPL